MKKMGLAIALAFVVGACGGILAAALFHGGDVHAAGRESGLPTELFSVGARVNGMEATYLVQEVRGDWVRLNAYRCIDKHNGPPGVSRWVCVPAVDTIWSKATAGSPDSRY